MPRYKNITTEAGRAHIAAMTQKIVQAAHTMFCEYGLKSTKTTQIAREAGIADGTVYLYFQNRAHLEAVVCAAFPDSIGAMVTKDYPTLPGTLEFVPAQQN